MVTDCGATHTSLWRRRLNDELNCNACGLYCKLLRFRSSLLSIADTGGVAGTNGSAQCYNCHTTATPLWRKDDEGKTVCNACGVYYKLHGSARLISMKSDVIRKRSRHDAFAAAAAAAARRSVADTHTSQAFYINATHSNSHHRDARTPGSGSSG
ncbi:hypothetical protein EDC04DRAFT_2581722 [Pisolithus marmoratus]|nr:hypothetical protein EDC04DRAFT_2581722 [Pisolithus marmoratus]